MKNFTSKFQFFIKGSLLVLIIFSNFSLFNQTVEAQPQCSRRSSDWLAYEKCVSARSTTENTKCETCFLTTEDEACLKVNNIAVCQEAWVRNGVVPTPTPTTPVSPSPASSGNSVCEKGYKDTGGLCIPDSPFEGQGGLAGSSSLSEIITMVIKALLYLSGVIAVVMVIVGGFWYMTSAGNTEQAEKGQTALTNAVIGLIVVLLSYAIVTVLTNVLIKGPTGGQKTDTTGFNGG